MKESMSMLGRVVVLLSFSRQESGNPTRTLAIASDPAKTNFETRIACAFIVILFVAVSACSGKQPGQAPDAAAGSGQQQTLGAGNTGASSAPSAATAPPGVLQALERTGISEEALRQAAKKLLTSLPTDDYDVPAAAAKVGRGVDDTFAFVRDNLAFDPYAGSQRGAAGALIVRAGNAVDRSLLLAAMLEANGHRTRLMRGVLSADDAEKLKARSQEPAPAAAEAPMEVSALAATSGLTEADVRRLIDATDAASRQARASISARVDQRVNSILTELKRAGVALASAAEPSAEAFRDHLWVQVFREGAWQDLDPSFRDAQPGQAFAKPTGAPIQAASLPSDWYHRLRIRVLVNRPGRDEPESVLDQELRIESMILDPLTLTFAPQGNDDPYRAGAFQPVLTTMGKPVRGTVFDLGFPQPSANPGANFAGALGGEDIAGQDAIVSIVLELTLKGPASSPKLITRQIVEPPTTQDVAVRAADVRDQLVSVYQLASGVGQLPYSWLARQQMKLVEQFADPGTRDRTLVPVDLMSLVGLVASGEFQAPVARRFYAQPLLIAERTRFAGQADGRRRLRQTLDILSNRVEFIGADPVVAVRQGVFETELERAAFQTAEVSNTSTVFERATSGVLVIRPPEPGKLNDRDFNEEAKLRIVEDLEAGYVVMVPNENVTIAGQQVIGWWRVHPDGGETLGRMYSGEGQGMTEKVISLIPSIYSGAGTYYCTKVGSTDGWCNPCALFAAGIVGGVIGGYGLATSSHTALFSAGRFAFTVGTAVYGGVKKSLSCVDWLTGGLL